MAWIKRRVEIEEVVLTARIKAPTDALLKEVMELGNWKTQEDRNGALDAILRRGLTEARKELTAAPVSARKKPKSKARGRSAGDGAVVPDGLVRSAEA